MAHNKIVRFVEEFCQEERFASYEAALFRFMDWLGGAPNPSAENGAPGSDNRELPFAAELAELVEVRELVRSKVNDSPGLAFLIGAVNLQAAAQVNAFEIVETMFGVLNRCLHVPLREAFVRRLYDFVETLGRQYGFAQNPHSNLGSQTHLGNLAAQVANNCTYQQRLAWFEKSAEHFEQALAVAQQLESISLNELATLCIALGHANMQCYHVGGHSDIRRLKRCVELLNDSKARLAADASLREPQVRVNILLAEVEATLASRLSDGIDEPRLVPEIRDSRVRAIRQHLKTGISHLESAVGVDESDQDVEPGLLVQLNLDVSKLYRRLADYESEQRANHLNASLRCATQAQVLCIKAPRFLIDCERNMVAALEAHWRHSGAIDAQQVEEAYEHAIELAIRGNSLYSLWVLARDYGQFLIDKSGDLVNWSKADHYLQQALGTLEVLLRNRDAVEDKYIRMFRQQTASIWEYCWRAAAETGRYEELPRIFETRRVVSSKLTYRYEPGSWLATEPQVLTLADDSALVYMMIGSLGFQAFVKHQQLSQEQDYIFQPDLDFAAARDVVDPWIVANQRMREPSPSHDDFDRLQAKLDEMLTKLGPLFWRRIDLRLTELGVSKVCLIRGRSLNLLPLHSLTLDSNWICDKYEISYASSASMYEQHVLGDRRELDLAIVADPTCDLKCASVEAEIVSQVFEPSRTSRITKKSATCEATLDFLRCVDLFHYAGHAKYDLKASESVVSGEGSLVLADGKLSQNDFKYMVLSKRPLIVLSACETGRTNWRDIESNGISDTFISAGARGVLATLWQVDDISTALFVHHFYQHGPTTSVASAIAKTQKWLRERPREEVVALLEQLGVPTYIINSVPQTELPFSEPYYWAPFHFLSGRNLATSEIYVIFDHPSDFPDHFVVRKWRSEFDGGRPIMTMLGVVALETQLSSARAHIPEGFDKSPLPEQDPTIAETWIQLG